MSDQEQWKLVPGWPYEVSNMGNVRRSEGGKRTRVGRLRKPQANPDGYSILVLSRIQGGEKQIKTFRIHVMVADALLPPRPPGATQINHKDGVKANNRADNLEYVTPSQNQRHSSRTGLMHPRRGTEHYAARLTEADVVELRERRKQGWSLKALGEAYGIGISAVSQIAKGKRWQHVPGETTG